MIRLIALGFGAAVAVLWLAGMGREAMAKEQAACLTRKLLRGRRDAKWKALKL